VAISKKQINKFAPSAVSILSFDTPHSTVVYIWQDSTWNF